MAKSIIEIENLSKCYRIGTNKEPYLSLRDEIAKFANRMRTKNKAQPELDFWALSDVSFSVQEGEAIGIIGRNGAGKSTLLKILSNITPPTKGLITMRGRIACLLEVGTGFHPELTGRENIFLNGAIMGMSRVEIRKKFDEIVAFAEVEKFLDTPVKRYSSGMYVRLAFAVAAHLEPEILIVDEVLAVGDAEFQKKCLGRMEEVAKGGRTVLFVSHNMSAVQSLCSHIVQLQTGRVIRNGTDVEKEIMEYLSCNTVRSITPSSPVILSNTIELIRLDFLPKTVLSCDALDFKLELLLKKETKINSLVLLIYSLMGTRVAILDLRPSLLPSLPEGIFSIKGGIASCPLVEGTYSIGIYIDCVDINADFLDLAELIVHSKIKSSDYAPYPAKVRGLLELPVIYLERTFI